MFATLLLNATFEPLKIISWQRAVTLMFLGKAELVEAYDEIIRGISTSIAMPSVVRLRRYARHDRRVKFSRGNVYRRDGYACQYCGVQPGASRLTLDHVVPRARGGRMEWTNIVTCCVTCNGRKADRTPEQARMELARPPVRPARMCAVARAEAPHTAWIDYLDG
ncbi:MAG: HNH endonuclease [Deltaproteobacteria bacterium]|nr:HNH endonuclease [Deltaproteobacteria bacterium]